MNIVAIMAHGHDIPFFCAGTLCKYQQAGHKVFIALTTGDTVPAAAEALNVPVRLLGFTPGGLHDGMAQRAAVLTAMRWAEADVILTHSLFDGDSDHAHTAKLVADSMLIVSGVMIGYICSAVTELVVTFANDAEIVNLHNWSKGSFSGMDWDDVAVMAVVVAVTCVPIFFMSKPLSAYQLGEAYAQNMGVNVRGLRVWMVVLSSILSACIVAFAGPISFVGVAVPHLVKRLLGTAKPILMIPACFLGGSVFCLFCDLLARTMFAPTELSISTVTAIFGAPVVLWIMAKRRSERGV